MTTGSVPIPALEAERLRLLGSFRIAGTEPEPEYDRFAALAARLFSAPVALVSFVDADRVWLKARFGVDIAEIVRGDAFCAHTILAEDVLVIPDTVEDTRFRANPFVAGPPHVRFYAGAPILAAPGQAVGTICILDVSPRPPLSPPERQILADLASLVVDRIEKRRLALAERDAKERFLKLAATSPDAIVCANAAGQIVFWNDGAIRIFGHTAETMLGRDIAAVLPPESRAPIDRWRRRLAERPQGKRDGKSELVCQRADGSRFPAEISYSGWDESDGFLLCGIIRDVTGRRETEAELKRLARTDSLTGLANRSAFLDRLDKAIRRVKARNRQSPGCALLLIDLDRFKHVNDAFGHGVGDRLLQRIAKRLEVLASDSVMPARLSGDEFTVIIDGDGDAAAAMAIAEEVRQTLSRPVRIHGHHVEVGASIGVATCPEHAASAHDLLANADLALYQAKADGGDRAVLFISTLRDAAMSRRQIESELRRAYREGEFVLHFQPQVTVSDGTIIGAEALLRWNHPERGLLSPEHFVSILETSPVSASVGNWVIDEAVSQAAAWREATGEPFRIGVNLFASQFVDGVLAGTVAGSLARHGLPAACFEVEITENIAMRRDAALAEPLRRLIETGVGVAFDDFGTGYGSLTHLKRVPVTRLKIDRGFVRGILTDPGDVAIVRAVVALGRSLGLGVIAEGVETEAQRAFLDALGCSEAQGYLFGRPLPAKDFDALLERGARQVA